MSKYVIINSSNRVVRIEQSDTLPTVESGLTAQLMTSNFPGFSREEGVYYTYTGGSFVKQDTRSILDLKAAKNVEINASRLSANQTFFTFQNKQIACDPLSRSDIDGVNGIVCLTGSLPTNFPGAWKAIDNTYVSIPDRATWVSFYDAMVNQGMLNFNKSQQLKAALVLADEIIEVENISW